MKIIDFLVELEKGDIPEKIIYNNHLFVYDSGCKDYKSEDCLWFFDEVIGDIRILSQEIMIIDDNLLVVQNEVNRPMDTIKKVNEDLDKLKRSKIMSDYLPGKLLMVDENGNEIEVQGTISINEEPDLWSIDEKDPLRNTYITHNSLSIDIDGSMMLSRKKFIKLLMSKGIGRNGANEIAKHVLKKNGRYTMMDVLMW